jgi:hypothetical protein
MRLILLFLLPALVVSIVLNPEHIVKEYNKLKIAMRNFDHYCQYLDNKEDIYICREVFMNQLFPIPVENKVLMIRLKQDAFYEYNDKLMAHFHRAGVLLVPTKPHVTKADLKKVTIKPLGFNIK